MELNRNTAVVFEPLTHSYLCGDRLLTGVTSLMKKHGLGADYTGVSGRVLSAAALRGTAVHSMLEDYDNGCGPVLDDVRDADGRTLATRELMKKILKSYAGLGLKVAASEYLVSDNELVASSIDKVVETGSPDEVELADVKTTSVLHRDALSVQLGIYRFLFEAQNPGLKVSGCFGIHIDMKTGAARRVDIEPWPGDKVAALLEAERGGRLYTEDGKATERALSSVLTGAELSDYLGIVRRLDEAERVVKTLSSALSGYKARLAAWMEENGADTLSADGGSVRLKRAYTRTSLDARRMKAERPDVYGKYLKETAVPASVTFEFDKQ